jgi:hypothetical protein
MSDRETIFDEGDGGMAALVAGLLAVALFVIGLFYYSGIGRTGDSQTIEIVAPAISGHVTPLEQ